MKNYKLPIIIGLFTLFTSYISYAQYPGAKLEINSKTGVYAVGDSIKVWARVFEGCSPELEFTIEKNMFTKISKEKVSLEEGLHLMYAGICSEPSHYVFMIGLPGGRGRPGSGKTSTIGAIIEPESFHSGYMPPKDLEKFWKKQIAQMRKMPLECTVKKAPQEKSDQTGYVCLDIEIPMPEGNPVRAYLAYPENAAPKSLPILIRPHSAGVKGDWCQCSIDRTIEDSKRGGGAIALDINAHGMLNGQPQEYYDNLEAGELKDYSSRPFTGHEDYYFRLMYLRLVRALDYLVTLPQWDGKRVVVYGESQGGAQAAALCSIDKRVTAAVLRVPAVMDLASRKQERGGTWPKSHGLKYEEFANVLPYYDGACLLSLTKARLFVEAGLVDYTCPPTCVAAGYNNAPSKDKTIVFFPYRTHVSTNMSKEDQETWKEQIVTPRENWLNEILK